MIDIQCISCDIFRLDILSGNHHIPQLHSPLTNPLASCQRLMPTISEITSLRMHEVAPTDSQTTAALSGARREQTLP